MIPRFHPLLPQHAPAAVTISRALVGKNWIFNAVFEQGTAHTVLFMKKHVLKIIECKIQQSNSGENLTELLTIGYQLLRPDSLYVRNRLVTGNYTLTGSYMLTPPVITQRQVQNL